MNPQVLLTPTSVNLQSVVDGGHRRPPSTDVHYFIDKQEAIAFKDELENEMKIYLKGALKKMMMFKKELKADLMFTK